MYPDEMGFRNARRAAFIDAIFATAVGVARGPIHREARP